MEKTSNYGLNKPGQNDNYNIEDLNENMDILDEKLSTDSIIDALFETVHTW